MQSTYPEALKAVLAFEGGYSNNPNDSGGPTNFGIIQREYDAYRNEKCEPKQSVKLITMAEVQAIYKTKYWDAIDGDELAVPIDWITFDAGVNMGVGTAIKMLNLAVDLPERLAPTPALIAKVKQMAGSSASLKALEAKEFLERIARYHAIVEAHAHDSVFLKGWLNRVAELEKDVATIAPASAQAAKPAAPKPAT